MPRRRPQARQTNLQMRASANELLDANNVAIPPVNIYQILDDQGVPVDFLPFSSKVEGIYLKNVTGAGIAINANHHAVKRRFTGAHELKHHLYDMPKYGEMLCSPDFRKQFIERRANSFAADLLVPPRFLKEVFQELDRTELLTVTALAQVFHVSYPVIVYRLHDLAYITNKQRDELLKPKGRHQDKRTAMIHRGSGNAARLKMPSLIAILGSSREFSYCSNCSESVYNPAWRMCHSCGGRLS